MKKFRIMLAALLSLSLLLVPQNLVFAVEKDAGLTESQIIEVVRALEILQGDENGDLKLDSSVTRAQFVKMAVAASVYKDDADVTLSTAQFPDVSANHWAAGYIRVGVSSGWIRGYLDGNFRPNGNVKLEEAVTITLKLLGYTDSDFIGSYPDGPLAKYKALKLNTGISASRGQELSRRDCMQLIYNALCTYTKNGAPYAQSLGYAADADGNIDYASLIESKKDGPYIVADENWKSALGLAENILCYKDGKNIAQSEIKPYDVLYYSKEFSKVWVYDTKTAGVIEALSPDKSNPSSVTVAGKTYPIVKKSAFAGNLSGGAFAVDDAVILLIGEKGEAIEAYPAKVLLAEKREEIGTPIRLFLNDTDAGEKELSDKSLVYYNAETSLALCYDKTASGLVEGFVPNKENPTGIVLSGTQYALSGAVKDAFKNESTYKENDFVTVYLGGGGEIEYAEFADIYDTDIYEDNNLSYDALLLKTLKGPEIVSGNAWKEKLGFDASTASYYRNGKAVEETTVKNYDVLYYSSAFKTVWVYSDRVTGVLEKINPSSVAPSSVTVAGSDYAIETSACAIQFAGKGDFVVGDTVTLLLGKSGIVAAVSPDKVSSTVFGLSTDVSKKEYTVDGKTYSDTFVTVSSFDGGTYSVRTDKSDFSTGVPVIVTLTDGVQTVKEYSGKYNNISELTSAIKAKRIAADAVLVDYYKKSFTTVYPARLSTLSLTTANVTYYSLNSDGELRYLILNDATGDNDSYGVILNFKGKYTFNTSAQNNSISSFTIPQLGAVGVKYNGQEADIITKLTELSPTALTDDNKILVGGKSYTIWDYAECFVMEQKGFSVSRDSDDKLSDVISKSSLDYIRTACADSTAKLRAFCDDKGMVRVLIYLAA